MKNICTTLFALMFVTTVFGQQGTNTSIVWKDKVIGKWKYNGVEQFGVVDSVIADQKKDMLEINADGSYSRIENRQSSKGSYTVAQGGVNTITFKDGTSGKSKMYYLKKSTADKLVIEYQTPDLIRTRYQYLKM